MGIEDRQLLLATAEGDRSSFEIFVRRHTAPVLRFCLNRLGDRQLAEDATQEAMMRLFQQTGQRRIPDDPGGWLIGIARRCCQEQQRRRHKHTAESLSSSTEPAMEGHPKTDSHIAALVDQLSDTDQALLHMKHTGGLRCREIAEQTGQPIGTVTARLTRVYAKLRTAMKREATA